MSISCALQAPEIAYDWVIMWWWALLSRSQPLHLSFFNPGLTNTVAYDCQSGRHAHGHGIKGSSAEPGGALALLA